MVLVYRVDVRALPAVHRARVLATLNAEAHAPRLAALDCSYGVLYTDGGGVLGAALVALAPPASGAPETHEVLRMCVPDGAPGRAVAAELLAVVRDQLPPGAAACFAGLGAHPQRAALEEVLAASGFAAAAPPASA